MKEILIAGGCWIIAGVVSEILHIKYSEDAGYDTNNLTKVGFRCFTCMFLIRKVIEYMLGIIIFGIVWTWKIIRVPIRVLGLICKTTGKKDATIDEVEL